MRLFPKNMSKHSLPLIAWASGGVAFLLVAAVFISNGQLNNTYSPSSVTAATALGDIQGIPSGYTGQTYPMPTSCYNDAYSNPNRHSRFNLPSCQSYPTTAVFSAHLQGVNQGRTGILYNGTPKYNGQPVDGNAGDPTLIEWSCQPYVAVTYTSCQFDASGHCYNSYEGYYTTSYANSSTGTNFPTGGALYGSKVIPFPAETTVYSLQCGSQTPVVIALGKLPKLSIQATPDTIAYNASSTISWVITGAPAGATCTVAGPGIAGTTLAGSKATPALTTNASYLMTCISAFGTQTASTSVTVGARPAPVLTLTATPNSVTTGNKTTINWSATNVASCSISGPGVFARTTSGSQLTSALSSNSTYTFTCATGDPSAPTKSTSITVPVTASVCTSAPGTPGVCSFSASPTSVLLGGASTITWSCPGSNNTTSTGTNFSTGGALSGTKVVNPITTTTYSLLCSSSGGTGTAVVTVAQPKVTLVATPPRVRKGTTSTLQWSSLNVLAGSCSLKSNLGPVASGDNGSKTVSVTQETVYTLSCATPAGAISAQVTVSLIPEYIEN